MTGEHDELGGTIPIPTYVVLLVIGAAFGGGAGLNAFLGPKVEASAIEQCTENATIALGVTAQHGQEFVELNQRITRLRDYVDQKTSQRYTQSDAREDWEDQKDINERERRWMNEHERRLQALEKKINNG